MNEDILEEYIAQLMVDGRSPKTCDSHKNVISYFLIWFGERDIKTIKKADVNKYIAYMNTNEREWQGRKRKLSSSTVLTRKTTIKQFLRWLHKEYPDQVPMLEDVIKLQRVKKTTLPKNLLTLNEIRAMIRESMELRDKAMISFLYESGCRKGELFNVKIQDVTFVSDGCEAVISGKTGPRRIFLIYCSQYLQNWINNHPCKDNPSAYVFCSMRSPFGQLSNSGLAEQIDIIRKRAGIDRHINPHLFRHSRATHLAKYMTEQEMKVFLGWTQGSSMAAIYVHLSGKDIDNKIRMMNGVPILEDDNDRLKTIECPRCHARCPAEIDRCAICMMALSEKAKREDDARLEKQAAELTKKLSQTINLADILREHEKMMRDDPEYAQQFRESVVPMAAKKKENKDNLRDPAYWDYNTEK